MVVTLASARYQAAPPRQNLWISKQSADRENHGQFSAAVPGNRSYVTPLGPPRLSYGQTTLAACSPTRTTEIGPHKGDAIHLFGPIGHDGRLFAVGDKDAAEATTFTHRKLENMRLEPMECEVVIPPRLSDSENRLRTLPPQKPAALTAPRPGEGHRA
ncbi:hypothetical protein GW17_00002784 [Ensete ventricosum]|nr:hypothetical protein GW17_00002784 [Ensete ventricosum]